MFDKRWTDPTAELSVHRGADEKTSHDALRLFSATLCGTLLWTLTGLSLYGMVVGDGDRAVACGYCLWAYTVMRVTLAAVCLGCLLVGGGPEALTQCSKCVWGGIGTAVLILIACVGGCIIVFKPLPALTQCTEHLTTPYLTAACCLFVYCDMTLLLGCLAASVGAATRALMTIMPEEEEEAC